jgi:hypothetical protein
MSSQAAIFTEEEIRASHTPDFDEKDWRQEGYALVEAHDNRQWELGEWMDRGVDALTKNKALKKAVQITKYAKPTLWDFARTARAFPDADSRYRDLSWSHHKEVATKKLSQESRDDLLKRAQGDEDGVWSIARLRAEVTNELKKQNRKVQTAPSEELSKMQVSVTKATKEFLTELAENKGEKLGIFAGNFLNERVQSEKASLGIQAAN